MIGVLGSAFAGATRYRASVQDDGVVELLERSTAADGTMETVDLVPLWRKVPTLDGGYRRWYGRCGWYGCGWGGLHRWTLPICARSMRSLGVTRVNAYCACGWQSTIGVSKLPDQLAVPDVRLRLKCSKGGARPMETRAN